jgi:hypothetical protein
VLTATVVCYIRTTSSPANANTAKDHHPGSHATITRGPEGEKVAHTSTHGPRPIEPGHGHSAVTGTTGATSTTHGPHNSNIANKLDPRVDSDADNRARHEAIGGAHGPHSSNLANKADPRVDSDRGEKNRLDLPDDLLTLFR